MPESQLEPLEAPLTTKPCRTCRLRSIAHRSKHGGVVESLFSLSCLPFTF